MFGPDISLWMTEWVIIGGGVLLLVILIMLMLKPKKKTLVKPSNTQTSKPVSSSSVNQAPVKPDKEVIAVKTEAKAVEQKTVKSEEQAVVPEKQETTTKAPEVKAVKEEKVVEVAKKEPETVEKTAEKVAKPAKYHISQNKDTDATHANEWRVRKEGSSKTIKYFNTQKEAIEFAEKLAENQDSSIVIHKKDGSIRKQNYTKK